MDFFRKKVRPVLTVICGFHANWETLELSRTHKQNCNRVLGLIEHTTASNMAFGAMYAARRRRSGYGR